MGDSDSRDAEAVSGTVSFETFRGCIRQTVDDHGRKVEERLAERDQEVAAHCWGRYRRSAERSAVRLDVSRSPFSIESLRAPSA